MATDEWQPPKCLQFRFNRTLHMCQNAEIYYVQQPPIRPSSMPPPLKFLLPDPYILQRILNELPLRLKSMHFTFEVQASTERKTVSQKQ